MLEELSPPVRLAAVTAASNGAGVLRHISGIQGAAAGLRQKDKLRTSAHRSWRCEGAVQNGAAGPARFAPELFRQPPRRRPADLQPRHRADCRPHASRRLGAQRRPSARRHLPLLCWCGVGHGKPLLPRARRVSVSGRPERREQRGAESAPGAPRRHRSAELAAKSEAPDAGPRLPQPRGLEVSRWRVALNPQRRIASMRSDAPDRVCNASMGAGKNGRSPAASSDSIDRHPPSELPRRSRRSLRGDDLEVERYS